MPSKYHLRSFHQDGYYHIYNRGAHKSEIFLDDKDYQTFISILQYYLLYPTGRPLSKPIPKKKGQTLPKTTPTYQLLCHCLMPNHFHLLIKQKLSPQLGSTISDFMKRLIVTYTMYFNDKHQHSGTLLQGRYKTVEVTSGPQLLHLSRYIHLNPTKLLNKTKKLSDYPYSSFPIYIGNKTTPWLNSQEILSEFTNSPTKKYLDFVESQTSDPTLINHLTLE